MSEREAAPPRNEKAPVTAYMVLRRDDETGAWSESGDVKAASATSAIRKLLEHSDIAVRDGGTYVAIPARSWKPVSVKAEQTVSLKLEAAG